jgi:hypothetical protein
MAIHTASEVSKIEIHISGDDFADLAPQPKTAVGEK